MIVCEDASQVAKIVAVRERLPLLERIIVMDPEGAGGDAIAVEDDETVQVRVLVCYEDSDEPLVDREALDCPVHVYLDAPLAGRTVIATRPSSRARALRPAMRTSAPRAGADRLP